jgi:hypothetical protein
VILLDPTPVTLSRADVAVDAHGWVEGSARLPVWEGTGNVQARSPRSDRTMSSGGGGPYAPTVAGEAVAYLPPGCPAQPGDVLAAADDPTPWLVAGVRVSRDPVGGGAFVVGGDTGIAVVVADLVRVSRDSGGLP